MDTEPSNISDIIEPSQNDIADKLEIFLITYNRASKLKNTLEQLFAENSPIKGFSITVIDNNSTDKTFDIVQEYCSKYNNLKYLKNKHNIGGNANITKAYCSANKEYVWVLCDDDMYDWSSWSEVEKAIRDKKDAIMVSTYEKPTLNIAQFFIQTTFVPGTIYRRDLLDSEVIGNMTYNISNMFPHLALSSKLINQKRDIHIVSTGIVIVGDNTDGLTNDDIYTRGYEESNVHPLMRDLNWMTGYANSLYMISDKKIRNYIATHNLFYMPKLNSAQVFFLNSKLSNGSLYNLLSIFLVLNFWSKIRFIINWLLYYTIFKIVYIHCRAIRTNSDEYIYMQYKIRILNLIKTKLFTIKIKIKEHNESCYFSGRFGDSFK